MVDFKFENEKFMQKLIDFLTFWRLIRQVWQKVSGLIQNVSKLQITLVLKAN